MLLLLLVSFMGLTWIYETMALVYESGNIIPRKNKTGILLHFVNLVSKLI